MAKRRGRKEREIPADFCPPGYEITELTEENIPLIAKRSGKTQLELMAMHMLMQEQGRKPRLRYKIVETVEGEAREDG